MPASRHFRSLVKKLQPVMAYLHPSFVEAQVLQRSPLRKVKIADLAALFARTLPPRQGALRVDGGPAIDDSDKPRISMTVQEPEVSEDHVNAADTAAPGLSGNPVVGVDLESSASEGGNASWESIFGNVGDVSLLGRMVIPFTYIYIQRFILLQPSINAVAFIISVIAIISSGSSPFSPAQLLWVNLIMDTFDALLQQGCTEYRSPLIINVKARNLFIQAAYQVVVLLSVFFKGEQLLRTLGHDHAISDRSVINTIIFNSFVLCQLFDAVNALQPERLNIFRGLCQNTRFIGILGTALLLQVALVELPHGVASIVDLGLKYWVVCITIGFLSWPLALVGKLIPVPANSCLPTSTSTSGHE